MGKRGTKRLPAAVLEARNSEKVKRRKDPIQIDPNEPTPPKWLTAKARPHWKQLAPELTEVKILSTIDSIGLANLADVLVDYLKARAAYEKVGIRVLNASDTPVLSPECKNWHTCCDKLLKCLREYGLTPSSRASLITNDSFTKKKEVQTKATVDPKVKKSYLKVM